MIRISFFALALILTATTGCRKRSQPAPPVAAEQPGTAASPQAAPAAPVAAMPATPAGGISPGAEKTEDRLPTAPSGSYKTSPVDMQLTEALQRHVEATGKMPADFNALVTGKYIAKMPTPPPGKRYAVDRANLQVVLLSQ